MKKLPIYLLLLAVTIIMISGCSDKKLKSIELTKDNFSILDSSKLRKVYILSTGRNVCLSYGYEFPISDPIKVEVIKMCIRDANQTESAIERASEKQTDKMKVCGLYFETRKEVYCMRIGWDDKFVYGDWWQSADLLSIFKGWELFEDLYKADPNWPTPKRRGQTFENGFPGPNLPD